MKLYTKKWRNGASGYVRHKNVIYVQIDGQIWVAWLKLLRICATEPSVATERIRDILPNSQGVKVAITCIDCNFKPKEPEKDGPKRPMVTQNSIKVWDQGSKFSKNCVVCHNFIATQSRENSTPIPHFEHKLLPRMKIISGNTPFPSNLFTSLGSTLLSLTNLNTYQ